MNFYHRGSNGDIIYSLPTIISYNTKATLYLRRKEHIDLLSRLLNLQPYIEDVKHKGRYGRILNRVPYIDLSAYYEIAWKKRNQHLATTHLEAQGRTFDLTQPWLEGVEPNHVADVIINRTSKYHDPIGQLDWHLLKPFADRCKFIGVTDPLHNEVKRFNRYKLGIEHHVTNDALEIAQVIKGCKLFIGNQSLPFAIAESMKHPRCLEWCQNFNNCQPHGDHGYTKLTNELIAKYLD